MDSRTSSRHDVDLLEQVLLDGNAEPTAVPLSLLEEITNCFSDDHRIGSGGFAVVYKGTVGKELVAVKKLSITFGLHEDKFHKEVECLMKAKHKNIVRCVGYCSDAQGRIVDNQGKLVMADIRNLLLCFEYVPNGSLDRYITDASCGLEWRERYGIIKGICEGLLHLHEKHILHLDLKPANILVDDQMIPKITDFGLSRCLDKEKTRDITSNVYGTLGYFAPEVLFSREVAFASDIYSLGIIILEILVGKKGYPEDENVLKNWTDRLEGSDQRDTQLEQVRVCIKIGIECMDFDPKKRPVARDIIDRLDKTASTVEMGISSVERKVSFLKDQYYQGKTAKLSPEYLGKDIREQAETEEHVEYVGSPRKDYSQQGQQDALGGQWSLWEAEYAKQNVTPQDARISSSNSLSSSNSGLLYKLNNLEVFNKKAQRNYIRYCGPMVERASNLKLFTMGELKPILKDEYLLRKDDFGKVYEGTIEKVLITVRKPSHVNMLNAKVFAQEVINQSKIICRNIVRIQGCCLESDVPMLVCEYFSKVSLHDVLHSNDKGPLDLDLRLSIAAESAQGLAYMHSQSSYTTILHGNFAPGYILLDEDYWPKISDFGISRMTGQYYEHTGGIIGDIAYMDPVYLQTGKLTEQSDVYSFGVVILELLTRKKATHTDNNSIVRKFLENHWQGRKSTELFDKEIAVTGDLDLLHDLAEIAVKCLNFDADLRPKMTEVAEWLSILNKSRERWFTS